MRDIYLPLFAVGVQTTGLFLAGLYFLKRERETARTPKDFLHLVRKIHAEAVQVAQDLEKLGTQTRRSPKSGAPLP